MLSDRQNKLFKLIIEDYIKTAKPVSSKSLLESLDCSSATIRNEMAYLEEIGLIEKMHTSSGRVPSEKGYRYYVDHVMKPKEITGDDMLKLQTIFRNNSLMLSDTIIKSMEIISELTNYTSVVLGKASLENKVSKVEVVPIESNRLMAIVVTDKGHVEYRNLAVDNVDLNDIKQTVELINQLIVGTPIDEVSKKLEFEVKPIMPKLVKQHEIIYDAFYNVFSDFSNNANFKMAGTKNMLMQPEFNDTDKIRDILSKFDDQEIINSIKEEDNGINIYIGSENDIDDNVTVIKTKYNFGGEEGTIALIGPKRMEYDRVFALLDYIKSNIER